MSAIETRPETAEERVARLTARLQDGFTRIGEAMSKGVAVDRWDEHFAKLLKEYESLEDILQEERERARSVATVQQGELSGMPRKEVA